MSDHFIGLTMLVTLSSPPGAQLRGKVSSVVAGKSLTLRDGKLHVQYTVFGIVAVSQKVESLTDTLS